MIIADSGQYLIFFWLIIIKPQLNLHSRDTCLGPEGVPWIYWYKFHCISIAVSRQNASYI